ncbi:Amyloid-beta A4 precursor protein-binding family A member 1 [Takifugu flavidus]|uniref:Amyloid-beta A4 protein-binding family A member 1 n=1 Tax=Takifugu flavidus TaxID=433684 RepID=A0A5C6NM49_9TELE|nr:Amyloid-beta A4 precursor protein-binding family A member 1 [Takifugu flavidus]
MNRNYQRDTSGEPNGTISGEPPARRSWRPCQMVNQDGEVNPHHHHHHHAHHHPPHHNHPPAGRGPARHHRRHFSSQGQAQSQAQSFGLVPVVAPSRPDFGSSRDTSAHRGQQPRPAVTRYRRHGDPNPRPKHHRRRQPVAETQASFVDEGPVDVQAQSQTTVDPVTEDRGLPHQTPVAVVTPTHLSADASKNNVQSPPETEENHQEIKKDYDQEKVEEKEEEKDEAEHCTDPCSPTRRSSCGKDDILADTDRADEHVEKAGEDVLNDIDADAHKCETTDLCSDTESAASLSMDGPLHSPPPLHSPTPPSSPDVPHFPKMDHFSEDTSLSTLPDIDPLPEDDEDYSESCSLSQLTSGSESYPKTYADFCLESYQKSHPEPVFETQSEPKAPSSFPEPLMTSYPDLHVEPQKQSVWRIAPNESQQTFSRNRLENVQKDPLSSPAQGCQSAGRQGRDQGPLPSPVDCSVGCRLHHYDGKSDSEGDSACSSPVTKGRRYAVKKVETWEQRPSEVEEQQDRAGEGPKDSGDAITIAIKDIRSAIEEVKIKAVRSPYTPDKPEEPIWVMRQEVSPTEDVQPLQTAASQTSPRSPSQSETAFRYVSDPAEDSRNIAITHVIIRSKETPSGHLSRTRTRSPVSTRNICTNSSLLCSRPRSSRLSRITYLCPNKKFVVHSVPGPCDPEDLVDGIIFAATYLGCTHLLSERTPTKSARMQQAQEAMSRVRVAQKQAKNRKKSPDGEAPSTAEVDLFMSMQRIKVLDADTQEALMDLPLRTISFIADIGNMVVLMARGKMVRSRSAQDSLENTAEQTNMSHDDRRLYRMICHVFESEDAQLIAQSIGQAFSVAYQEFLRANGIDPEDLSQREYSDLLNTQDMYNEDLIHFSKSENCKDVYIEKQKGEILGVVIVESGWGSILPTVIIASLMHAGPAEKSGRLNIGDQIMTVNGTSLVGLPLSTCQSIIKGLKSQSRIKMNIVRCPPVTMVLIRRPDLRYQLGFSVQNGIICSLMRGGIAERGGVRVGHRIIEINSQSVVATPHEKIVQILSNAMGEIHMKTMPAAMYRLLTAQEQPVYI